MARRNGPVARRAAAAVILIAAWCGTVFAQSPDPVARARELIEKKDAQAAWALLAPLATSRAGEVDFDYWLGVAALETDRLEQAAFAFERVLDRQPEFDSARLELARVYLRMGSLDLAEQEFRRLLPRAKNEEGRRTLEQYLAEVERLKARQRFSVTGYLEAGAGHDSNLSSAARDFSGAVESSFGLPGISPTGNSVQRSAPFGTAAGGISAAWKLAEHRTAFASAEARYRGYQDEPDFDFSLLDVSAGHQWRRGEHTYTAVAFGQVFRQQGAFDDTISASRLTNDRDAYGAFVEFRRDLSATLQGAAGLQVAAFRYDTNPVQDTDQAQVFGALIHRPGWWKGGTIGLSAQLSKDDAKRPLNEFTSTTVSRHGGGVRLTMASDPTARLSWSAYAAYTLRIDDDEFARATLVSIGRDELGEATVRLSWRFADGWLAQPSITWVRNLSNIPIYTFTKLEGGVVVRREFQ